MLNFLEDLEYQLSFDYDLWIEIKNDKIVITLGNEQYITDSMFKAFKELQ